MPGERVNHGHDYSERLRRTLAALHPQPVGALEVGRRADLVVLDGDTAALACKSGDAILDSLVFAAHRDSVKHVMVAGRWRIRDGHHDHEDAIFDRYKRTLATLLA